MRFYWIKQKIYLVKQEVLTFFPSKPVTKISFVPDVPKVHRDIHIYVDPSATKHKDENGNVIVRDGKNWKTAYPSLNQAMALYSNYDLMKENTSLTFECRGGADEEQVEFSGWVTDLDNYIKVMAPIPPNSVKVFNSKVYRT
jgi:hypothetical protein